MNNNWFVSCSPLNEEHLINDLHYSRWIITQPICCPVGHVELCNPSHVLVLMCGNSSPKLSYTDQTNNLFICRLFYLVVSNSKCSYHVAVLSLTLQSENRVTSMLHSINPCVCLHSGPVLVANLLRMYGEESTSLGCNDFKVNLSSCNN